MSPLKGVIRSKLGDAAKSLSYIFTEPRIRYRMARPEEPGDATP